MSRIKYPGTAVHHKALVKSIRGKYEQVLDLTTNDLVIPHACPSGADGFIDITTRNGEATQTVTIKSNGRAWVDVCCRFIEYDASSKQGAEIERSIVVSGDICCQISVDSVIQAPKRA